jgi:regulation of enolase protein 1 (concanavalin A-like superfamily)
LTAAPGVHSKVHIEYKDRNGWVKFREITGWTFEKGRNLDIGVMACSPGESSVRVEFWDIVAQDYSELLVENGLPKGTLGPHMQFGIGSEA